MEKIFISHVEEDAQSAFEIALSLEEAGYPTWVYEFDGIPGKSYLIQTKEAIEHSVAAIVIISHHSMGSSQITKEVVRAHESDKHFIPLLKNVKHAEFQHRQPEWREAMGAATSISIPQRGAYAVTGRIIDGLKSLNIKPQQKADYRKIGLLKNALEELKSGKKFEIDYKSRDGSPEKDSIVARQKKKLLIRRVVGLIIAIILLIILYIFLTGGFGNLTVENITESLRKFFNSIFNSSQP